MEAFIRGLPKAELHVHIEGTLEPEMMFELARRNEVPLRFASVEDVRAAYEFTDLQSFLDIYYEGARHVSRSLGAQAVRQGLQGSCVSAPVAG